MATLSSYLANCNIILEVPFILECLACGFRWESASADWKCCPMCEKDDIVVIGVKKAEEPSG